MDFNKIGNEIVANIGGSENVQSLSHCMTRLRFVLKDESKVNKSAVNGIDGVLGSTFGAGQYQVIMGKNLAAAFEALNKNFAFDTKGGAGVAGATDKGSTKAKEPLTPKSAFMVVVNYMSGSVSPVITGLVAGGMLKLVLYILTLAWPGIAELSTYNLISILADVPFYFMPVFVAFGASKKLGCSPVLPMLLACALISPSFIGLEGAASVFGLPVPVLKYSSTAIPAMLSTLTVYWFEKLFNKIIPGILRNTIVAPLTLLASFVLTFVVLAPLGNLVGSGVVNLIVMLQKVANPLALAVYTAVLPFMIMAGVHTLVAPFMLENYSTLGYDPLFRVGLLLQLLAEGGAALGIAVHMKEKEKRADAISMCVSAVFAGITEPAIFGINMKYKSGLYGALSGAVAGGLIAGVFNIRSYLSTKNTILALPTFQDTMLPAALACAVTFAVSFLVTAILYRRSNKVK